MIKCPNCGSTAQHKPIDHECVLWYDRVTLYVTYTCGCGWKFCTREVLPRDKEKEEMYIENV